ncbi:MAG: hypothetical protein ACOWWR_05420 [Eubacteriales bacterium]
MYIFKTSGKTIDSVIRNQKHAFKAKPKEWDTGELVLISKNKRDCSYGEKQIQYIAKINNIRPMLPGECEKLWPGNTGRWKYLVELTDTKQIAKSFDLQDILVEDEYYKRYNGVMCYKRLPLKDERLVEAYLNKVGSF